MITTKRLEIIPCEIRHLEAFARSREELAKMLALRLPPSWPAFPEAYAPPETAAPDPRPWGSYFFLCPALGSLVGSGGFKGKPDSTGTVEIGYEIGKEHWNRGFASEATQGMIDFAFRHEEVKFVTAHTLAEQNASCTVLQKSGLTFIREINVPTEGNIWFWRISKEEHAKRLS